MKKNNKGFTLIELLVVVAIIGILAAVGVVAYSGYTSSAKKSGAKSNHATVVKYIAAELQKCNIGETSAMKDKAGTDKLTCSSRTSAGEVSKAATAALSEFKNSYGTTGGSGLAIFDAAKFDAKADFEVRLPVNPENLSKKIENADLWDQTCVNCKYI